MRKQHISTEFSTTEIVKYFITGVMPEKRKGRIDSEMEFDERVKLLEPFGYTREFLIDQSQLIFKLLKLKDWPLNIDKSINIIYDDAALVNYINTVLDQPIVVPTITTTLMLDILAADEIYRGRDGKHVGWPLLNEEQLVGLCMHYNRAIYDSDIPIMQFMRELRPFSGYLNKRMTVDPTFEHDRNNQVETHTKRLHQILKISKGHLVAAGGFALNRFKRSPRQERGDVDLFIIGFKEHEVEEAEAMVQDVIETMRTWVEHEDEILKGDEHRDIFKVTRNQNVVNMLILAEQGIDFQETYPGFATPLNCYHVFQIVLRLYPSTGNILTDISLPIGGFDLYSCAIAYYLHPGDEVGSIYATPAGAFAIATGLNMVNSGRVSTSMNRRLVKYRTRGFAIACPGVRIEEFSKMQPHQKEFGVFFRTPNIGWTRSANTDVSDYQYAEEQSDCFASNFEVLLTNKLEQYVVSNEESYEDVISKLNDMYEGNIQGVFNFASNEDEEILGDLPLINSLKYYKFFIPHFQELELAEVKFEELGELKTIEAKQECLKTAIIRAKVFIQENIRLISEDEDDVVKPRFAALKEEFVAIMKRRMSKAIFELKAIKVNIKNPLRQHTASNNPLVVDPATWWGADYVKTTLGFPNEIYIILRAACKFDRSTFINVLLPYLVRAYADGITENLMQFDIHNAVRSRYIFGNVRARMLHPEKYPGEDVFESHSDDNPTPTYVPELLHVLHTIDELLPADPDRLAPFMTDEPQRQLGQFGRYVHPGPAVLPNINHLMAPMGVAPAPNIGPQLLGVLYDQHGQPIFMHNAADNVMFVQQDFPRRAAPNYNEYSDSDEIPPSDSDEDHE